MEYESINYKRPMSIDHEYQVQQQLHKQPEIDGNDLTKFKNVVREWLKCDDELRQLKQGVKERNKKIKDLTPQIMEFMASNQIEDLNTQVGGRIHYHTTHAKKPLNKDNMVKCLTNYFNDSGQASEIAEHLLNNREIYDRYSLKRTEIPSSN
jgi:hypothetical protein